MAEPRRIEVELSDYLSDLRPEGLKGLASAPITYRAERLLDVFQVEARRYGKIGHGELVSALLHATLPDRATLAVILEEYREARVWETRHSLGEITSHEGTWEVVLRGQGG